MTSELAITAAVTVLAVLAVKAKFFRGLFKILRCIYYLRKLPLDLDPEWLVGHSRYSNPETLVHVIEKILQDPNRPGRCGIARSDLAPFMHLAIVNTPETVGAILRSSEPKNPYVYSFLVPWIGEGLLISNGIEEMGSQQAPAHACIPLQGAGRLCQCVRLGCECAAGEMERSTSRSRRRKWNDCKGERVTGHSPADLGCDPALCHELPVRVSN